MSGSSPKKTQRHIRFVTVGTEQDVLKGTAIVAVQNNHSGANLAAISFYKPWKQWVVAEFNPRSVWSADCLHDVAGKLEDLNHGRASCR